jgi:hypothetical protein
VTVTAGALFATLAGCGGGGPGGGSDSPAVAAGSAPPVASAPPSEAVAGEAPASALVPRLPAATAAPDRPEPSAPPLGPSIRVTDGRSVAALEPGTGQLRATWPAAKVSPAGDWTVAAVKDAGGGAAAEWIDLLGATNRTGPIPTGFVPILTSRDGQWAVLQQPAPAVAPGEIGPGRTRSRFVITNGRGWSRDVQLDGNFVPEAFGADDGMQPISMQLIEYLPPAHPTRYRVRTLDLVNGTVQLPVSLRDKATPVDEAMAGTSRTQVDAPLSDLLFTLYQPAPAGEATAETWEYGFVHTLATSWAGVWCIDLPEQLGLEGNAGALALRPDEGALYVVTGAGRIAVIPLADLQQLAVSRTAVLGVRDGAPPVVVAGRNRIWVALGQHLLVVEPQGLKVVARAELPATVTALALDRTGEQLVTADAEHLRTWSLDAGGSVVQDASAAIALPPGLGPISRVVLP